MCLPAGQANAERSSKIGGTAKTGYRHSLRVHRWDNVGPQRGVDEAGGKKPH